MSTMSMLARTMTVVATVALAVAACGANATPGQTSGSPGAQSVPPALRVGLIPNIAPEDQKAKYQPLGAYLGTALGRDVELFVASDYAGVVAALASDRIDVAYLGGLTYTQAELQVPLTPLVTEIDALTGTPQYDSAIVVAAESPWQTVQEVVKAKGSFAFGDPASTSGSLYPRVMLTEAGVTCDTVELTACPPLESVVFTGGHDATAQAVLSGSVDAGGVELRILKRLEAEGKVPAQALRVIGTTRVQGYPWVARSALGVDLTNRITEAFLAIQNPQLLDLLRATSYVRVTAADYEDVRTQGVALGLLKAS